MSWPQAPLSAITWLELTDAGKTVVNTVTSGGNIPSQVLVVPVGKKNHLAWKQRFSNRRRQILHQLVVGEFTIAQKLGFGFVDDVDQCKELLLLRLPWRGVLLKDFFLQQYPSAEFRAKRQFMVACARLIRRLHDAGLSIDGPLEGEILVPVKGVFVQFCLSGAQPLRLRNGSLGIGERLKALGRLFAFAFGKTTRSERLRFVAAYFDQSLCNQTFRQFLQCLESTGKSHALRQWRRQARLCLSNNQTFVHEKRDGFRIHRLRTSAAETALSALLPDPDRCFDGAVIYKPGSRTHAGLIELAGQRYFLKRYNAPTGWFTLMNAVRRCRAVRTWLATWGFVVRGLPIAKPVLCLEKRRFRLLGSCYILMEFVEGSIQLNAAWSHLNPAGQGACLRRLGSVLGQLHYSGGVHGDLKWNNIVIDNNDPADARLVDFDGSGVFRRPTLVRAQRDLDRFLRDLRNQNVSDSLFVALVHAWSRWSGAI